MKTYVAPAAVLTEVDRILAADRHSFQHSPLETVIEAVSRGRHYAWIGIYLATNQSNSKQLLGAGGDAQPGQVSSPDMKSKILVSMRLAGREFGVLDVESDKENAFGVEDRVLLENLANRLARFLAGPGQYIVRKARESQNFSKPAKKAPAKKR